MSHTSTGLWTHFLPLLRSGALMKSPRRARMHTVDIDDRIQLHDYIFSRSFK